MLGKSLKRSCPRVLSDLIKQRSNFTGLCVAAVFYFASMKLDPANEMKHDRQF